MLAVVPCVVYAIGTLVRQERFGAQPTIAAIVAIGSLWLVRASLSSR
jgi:hypothetical protein